MEVRKCIYKKPDIGTEDHIFDIWGLENDNENVKDIEET